MEENKKETVTEVKKEGKVTVERTVTKEDGKETSVSVKIGVPCIISGFKTSTL